MSGNINAIIAIPVLMFLCVGGAFAQEQVAAETLTLERAIEMALESNRGLRNAEIDVEKAADKTAAYRTRRFPSFKSTSLISQPLTKFDFTFEKGVFGDYPGTGPIPNNDVKISSDLTPTALVTGQVQQPITQLFRINANIKQLKLGEEIAKEQTREKRQATVKEVKNAYYKIIQTQSAFQSLDETSKLYEELERVTENYVIQQAALKPELMDVQARRAKVDYEMLTLKNALASQKEQLNNLIGRDIGIEFNVAPTLEAAQFLMRTTDLKAAQETALAQRPEIKQARLRAQQARLDTKAKKSEFIPDVSLSFNYLSPFSYSSVLPKNIMSVGVSVEFEIFDWGRKKHEISEKKGTERQADNNVREAESMILIELNSRFRKLQESCRLLSVTRMSQETAKASMQVIAHKYSFQSVLLKDVLQAQGALADANHQYQKALAEFWTAKAEFEKAIGEEK